MRRESAGRQRAILILVLVAYLGAAACGGGEDEAVAPSAPSVVAPPSPAGTNGISADEAKRLGVFVAEFDARLDGPVRTSEGRRVFRLVNVGQRDDRYQVSVEPASSGTVEPAELALTTGQSSDLTVRTTAPATLRIWSIGRGAEIAAQPLA